MAGIRVLNALMALVVVLALVGCAGASADLRHPFPDPQGQAAAPAGSGGMAAFPAPSTLRQASDLISGVFRFGSQFVSAWPNDSVTPNGRRLSYEPDWQAGGLSGAAYAIYSFNGTGYQTDGRLRLVWEHPGLDYTKVWIGLANFTRDRWDWVRLRDENIVVYNRSDYTYLGALYAAVVCIGNEPWELKSIRICPEPPPTVIKVSPVYVNQGVAVTIVPTLEGFAQTFKWDFGGAGVPDQSTEMSPGIVPGALGDYNASLKVASVYGEDQFDFVLHVTEPPGQGDWTMFGREPAHNRRSPYLAAQTSNLLWSYTTDDALYSSPVLGADGTIYVGSNDYYLYAFYPDGSLRWRYPTGYWVWGSPTLGVDGTVYVGSFDNKLYAIAPNGYLLWALPTGDWIRSSPAVGPDGTIYVGSRDGKLYAVSPGGELVWSYATADGVDSSPALAADGTIYVGSDDFFLYAINADGSLKWKYLTGDMVWSSPSIAADGTVYVGSYDNKLYAINPDGTLKWAYQTGFKVGSSPAIGEDGTIYAGSYDKKLYAINPDGTLKWSYLTGGEVRSSPSLGVDGTVYFGSNDFKIHAVSADGSMKWQYATKWYGWSSPAIGVDGKVYVGSYDGTLYVFGE